MPFAKCNGIDLNYEVYGQGEPLILVMGFSCDRNLWMLQVPALMERFLVVTFDNRGVGRSDKPTGPYSTRLMAEDTVCLMDHLGIEKAHLLGISMGGMIAQEIAITYPDRVNKLVLVATYALQDDVSSGWTDEMKSTAKLPIRRLVSNLMVLASDSRILKRFILSFELLTMGRAGTDGLKSQLGATISHDSSKRLSSIKAPTLVLVGTSDRVIKPSSSEYLSGHIDGSKLVKIEGGSHMLCTDYRVKFNEEVLGFLN